MDKATQDETPIESINYLLVQVARLHRARADMLLEPLGLYRGQPPVIIALHNTPGMTQGELATQLHVTPATMTRLLQRLERAGFVTRQSDADDQRISRFALTAAGEAIRMTMMATLRQLEAETFAGLTPAELAIMRQLLERLRTNLRARLDAR
ncbi:MAG TPA: MarR family transcriptional regulator [Chloroflexi bacterium]|nr:MarR family transcriptional regulator [Chloroflexota bacterium]HHW84747.1 MarR family transcriptional regulator [Chloroflexota bacterium]